VGIASVLAVSSGSTVGLGVPAIVGVLLVADAGVPIPFPTDLLLIVLGERAASGAIPVWLAVLAVELIAVVSTLVLFHLCRGPGYRLVARFGRFIGLTAERMARARAVIALGRRRRSSWRLGSSSSSPSGRG
jgi:membrane protein DedA with SNARE-associated domain